MMAANELVTAPESTAEPVDQATAALAATGIAEGPGEPEGEHAAAEVPKKKKKSSAARKKNKKLIKEQTSPPTVPVSKMFLANAFPEGEIQPYDPSKFLDENRARVPLSELKERERLTQEEPQGNYNLIRKASEVHRQVRQYAQRTIKPGMSLTDAANIIEDGTRTLVEENGFEAGIGFPTGLNLNEIAAHFSPNTGDKHVIGEKDVIKIDFGVQVQGRIVDSAFTLAFDETHQPLLDAVRAATNKGIEEAGIDARLGEIGAAIQEVMESHEYEVNGKLQQVKCIRNLQGHNIRPYQIHGGKSVPIVASPNNDVKMDEGEYFAIETFGSTGRGLVIHQGETSHYAKKFGLPANVGKTLRLQSAKNLLRTIDNNFGTLPWCRRYLERTGEKSYLLGLRHLVDNGIVQDYPPLADIPGSMTAQFEHTILLRPTGKEVVSRGDDY